MSSVFLPRSSPFKVLLAFVCVCDGGEGGVLRHIGQWAENTTFGTKWLWVQNHLPPPSAVENLGKLFYLLSKSLNVSKVGFGVKW